MAVTSDPTDLSRLDFTKGDGLLPAIIQHADTGAVLMLGYMNAAALEAPHARPRGPPCHEGTATCFGDAPLTGATRLGFLAELAGIIEQRITEAPEDSY